MKYEVTANRLRTALNDARITQQELSNSTGLNKSSISQWVNGKNRPDSFSAYAISRVLNVAPEWLMGFEAPQNGNNSELQKIIELYKNADENTQAVIKRLLGYEKIGDKHEKR